MNYLGILAALLPYFGYILLGAVANRLGISRGKPEKYLNITLINVMYPILSFNFIIGNPVMENLTRIASAPFVGFFSIVAGFGAAYFASAFMKGMREESRGSFSFSVGMYNYLFFAVPLTAALYGEHVVGVLLIHNLGNDIAVWSVGAGLIAGGGLYNPLRLFKNPPIVAIFLALIINHFTGGAPMPAFLKMFTSTVALIAIPAGLFISGATLADNMKMFNKKDGLKLMGAGVAIRLFLAPFIVVGIVALLPVPKEVKMVTAIQASMPSGVSTAVIIRYFKGDASIAVPVIISTMLIAIFTMPLWIRIFQAVLGV